MIPTHYDGRVSRAKKEPPTAIAAWVRAVREANKLSQEAFGDAVGAHRTTVVRWERGQMGQHFESIALIRKAFPTAPPPPIEGLSDPDRSVVLSAEKGTNVELTEGAIVARDIDRQPALLQARLRNAALVAIQEELKSIAKEAAAHQNPTEPDADNEARPRTGKSSSGHGKTRT